MTVTFKTFGRLDNPIERGVRHTTDDIKERGKAWNIIKQGTKGDQHKREGLHHHDEYTSLRIVARFSTRSGGSQLVVAVALWTLAVRSWIHSLRSTKR